MERLEHLIKRIDYGRTVANESAKMFFSLEPTLRFALTNFLLRKHPGEVAGKPLSHMSILELINIFEELVDLDEEIEDQIYDIYYGITSYRLITYTQVHATNYNAAIKTGTSHFKRADQYLDIMEEVVQKLLGRLGKGSRAERLPENN